MNKLEKLYNGPHLVKTDQTIFFDVDDTLIDWSAIGPEDGPSRLVTIFNGETQFFTAKRMEANINALLWHKQVGHFVVVWSAAGYEHAKAVVEALGLNGYVDLIIAKPELFYDDLPAHEWLHESKRKWTPPK